MRSAVSVSPEVRSSLCAERGGSAGLSGSSTSGGSWGALGPGGQVVVAVVQRSSQAAAQGQSVGRCSTSRRAEEAIRAGTVIRWVRRVAHRALACRAEAAAPAARRRLKARAASASQAALAVNFPDGACASGPSFSSAMTCSMMAWSRWVSSAGDRGEGGVGDEPVVPPQGEQLVLVSRCCRAAMVALFSRCDPAHDQPAGHLPLLGVGGERGEVDLGDLRFGDPPVLVAASQIALRVADRGPRRAQGSPRSPVAPRGSSAR